MLTAYLSVTLVPILIGAALATVSIIACVIYVRRTVRDYTEKEADWEKTAEKMTPEDDDVPEDFEPPLEEVEVTVSGKRCGTRVLGTKSVRAVRGFFITFTDAEGLEYDFQVEEDVYLSIDEGQHGSIAIVNGNFYGFCPDEE